MRLSHLPKVTDNKWETYSKSDLFDTPSFPWEHFLAYFSYPTVKTASSSGNFLTNWETSVVF